MPASGLRPGPARASFAVKTQRIQSSGGAASDGKRSAMPAIGRGIGMMRHVRAEAIRSNRIDLHQCSRRCASDSQSGRRPERDGSWRRVQVQWDTRHSQPRGKSRPPHHGEQRWHAQHQVPRMAHCDICRTCRCIVRRAARIRLRQAGRPPPTPHPLSFLLSPSLECMCMQQ